MRAGTNYLLLKKTGFLLSRDELYQLKTDLKTQFKAYKITRKWEMRTRKEKH